MINELASGPDESPATVDFLWQLTIALHVAFDLPEGEGLRRALDAPHALNNKDALFTWVEGQVRRRDGGACMPLMNELVQRLHDQLQREEQLLWL